MGSIPASFNLGSSYGADHLDCDFEMTGQRRWANTIVHSVAPIRDSLGSDRLSLDE